MGQDTEIKTHAWGSLEWANSQLRFGISILQGSAGILQSLKGRIQLALILRDQLREYRFSWQAKILEHWIHRAQGGEFP
jgi:hypothetical protein